MSSIAVSSIVFACVFGGAILGMSIRAILPQPHLSPESGTRGMDNVILGSNTGDNYAVNFVRNHNGRRGGARVHVRDERAR